jgi:glycosyltransferase involved in cell wall biosynthesis
MRIAFYAPLKPPTHDVPSGDRAMARLLIEALGRAGHEVTLASRFRSRDGAGDPARQLRLAALGRRLADRFVARARAQRERRPDVWLTYHLYYKAPDWLGPCVADALGIPYLVAEASDAPKRRDGPWRLGHEAARAALGRADAVIGLNGADRECVLPLLADPARWLPLKPFIDTAPFAAPADRAARRQRLAARLDLDPSVPWLVAVGMMRPGDKLASYRALGPALARLIEPAWRLLVVGDGAARREVEAALAPVAARTRYLGQAAPAEMPGLLAACDVAVWPAVNEAYGLALLEAQAAGLPVVAGAVGGVPEIVADGRTGRLVPPGDPDAFAAALRPLLADPALRRRLGAAAARRAAQQHDIATAAAELDALLRRLAGRIAA